MVRAAVLEARLPSTTAIEADGVLSPTSDGLSFVTVAQHYCHGCLRCLPRLGRCGALLEASRGLLSTQQSSSGSSKLRSWALLNHTNPQATNSLGCFPGVS